MLGIISDTEKSNSQTNNQQKVNPDSTSSYSNASIVASKVQTWSQAERCFNAQSKA